MSEDSNNRLDGMEQRLIKIERYSKATIVALMGDLENPDRPGLVSRLHKMEDTQKVDAGRIDRLEAEHRAAQRALLKWVVGLLTAILLTLITIVLSQPASS